MDFEDSIRKAAERAKRAVNRAMGNYDRGLVVDEEELTARLVGNLDAELDGKIGDLKWSVSNVRHRRGIASEEGTIGADIVINVSLETSERRYSKGVLVQAKRAEPNEELSKARHIELTGQCDDMLKITPASFVFDYARGSMRCGSASRIAGTTNRKLYEECTWTSYRFFLELFRCPIGDPHITSPFVKDLPIAELTFVEIKARGG